MEPVTRRRRVGGDIVSQCTCAINTEARGQGPCDASQVSSSDNCVFQESFRTPTMTLPRSPPGGQDKRRWIRVKTRSSV